jgi:hypothetical protein
LLFKLLLIQKNIKLIFLNIVLYNFNILLLKIRKKSIIQTQ